MNLYASIVPAATGTVVAVTAQARFDVIENGLGAASICLRKDSSRLWRALPSLEVDKRADRRRMCGVGRQLCRYRSARELCAASFCGAPLVLALRMSGRAWIGPGRRVPIGSGQAVTAGRVCMNERAGRHVAGALVRVGCVVFTRCRPAYGGRARPRPTGSCPWPGCWPAIRAWSRAHGHYDR